MNVRHTRLLGWLAPAAALASAGCFATREDVRLLQTDIQAVRAERVNSDSAMRAQLNRVATTLATVSDSMLSLSGRLTRFQGDVRGELYELGQQLIQIQELTGQSQRRLQELRASLEQRAQALAPSAPTPVTTPPPTGGAGTPSAGASPAGTPTGAAPSSSAPPAGATGAPAPTSGTPGPNALFELSLDQLRRGSAGAARTGFLELLRQYPTSDVADDAQFYIGETYSVEGNAAAADSAYAAVVARYPASPRAPTALYKRAVAMQAAGNAAGARAALNELIAKYPRSDEAALARERLQTIK